MRRTGMLIAVFLLAGALTFPAQATSQEDADTLYKLGLFKGSGSGYELDRAATREEAATMLVRFLGAETAAQAGQWVTPFTDVPDWAKPYVGYAYTNGLIQGVGPNAFGVRTRVDANQYATMLLRALGYTSGKDGDFAWDKAAEFAAGLGMDVSATAELPFSRGNMVTLSRTALEQVGKGDGVTLLAKLIDSGVFSEAEARAAGILPKAAIWEGSKLVVPAGATNAYVLQALPNVSERSTSDFNEHLSDHYTSEQIAFISTMRLPVRECDLKPTELFTEGLLQDDSDNPYWTELGRVAFGRNYFLDNDGNVLGVCDGVPRGDGYYIIETKGLVDGPMLTKAVNDKINYAMEDYGTRTASWKLLGEEWSDRFGAQTYLIGLETEPSIDLSRLYNMVLVEQGKNRTPTAEELRGEVADWMLYAIFLSDYGIRGMGDNEYHESAYFSENARLERSEDGTYFVRTSSDPRINAVTIILFDDSGKVAGVLRT